MGGPDAIGVGAFPQQAQSTSGFCSGKGQPDRSPALPPVFPVSTQNLSPEFQVPSRSVFSQGPLGTGLDSAEGFHFTNTKVITGLGARATNSTLLGITLTFFFF